MGSHVGLSAPVDLLSSVVALEPSCLTSGRLKLIFPPWVSRAAEWRGWLGGFLREVPYSLHHVIQAVAHQLTEEIAHHKSGMEEWDLHSPHQWQALCRAIIWGKPSSCQYLVSNPTLCSYCPVLHEKCSKMNCGI